MYGADTNWEHFLFVFSTTVATLHPVVLQVRNGSSASPPEAGFVCCIVLAIRQFSRQLIVNCLLLCSAVGHLDLMPLHLASPPSRGLGDQSTFPGIGNWARPHSACSSGQVCAAALPA